jgi:hypothetical protein
MVLTSSLDCGISLPSSVSLATLRKGSCSKFNGEKFPSDLGRGVGCLGVAVHKEIEAQGRPLNWERALVKVPIRTLRAHMERGISVNNRLGFVFLPHSSKYG